MFHIIEDQPYIYEFISELLNGIGYETACFSCPEAYINYVRTPEFKRPLAIITDINMPTMNGYKMIDQISRLVPKLRFVVMTGEPHIHSEHKAKACMYLRKPFKVEALIEIIDAILRCESSSPSCMHGCKAIADRSHFEIYAWECPLGCTTCTDHC